MRRLALNARVLLLTAGTVGCPLPPEQVTCEEENACVPSTGSTTGASADSDSGSDTPGPDTDTDTDTSTSTGTSTGSGTDSGDSTGGAGSSTTGDTTSAETTGLAPFCGDGVVNQDFEECDDSSPSADGPCSPLCQRERIIFVLSILVNGKLSGLQGADAYCRSQAHKAQVADPTSPIKDAKNFKALLPSSTETIFERHFRGEGRYRLINGLTVSYSFNRLFSEPLQVAINVDEFGQTRNVSVWTASTANGQPYPGIDFCGDWTSVKGSASWGVSDHTDAEWIEVPDEIVQQPTEHCLSTKALYCVEQQ
jgi:cysteine-rich repeat protein